MGWAGPEEKGWALPCSVAPIRACKHTLCRTRVCKHTLCQDLDLVHLILDLRALSRSVPTTHASTHRVEDLDLVQVPRPAEPAAVGRDLGGAVGLGVGLGAVLLLAAIRRYVATLIGRFGLVPPPPPTKPYRQSAPNLGGEDGRGQGRGGPRIVL